jgi:hypothetical protein
MKLSQNLFPHLLNCLFLVYFTMLSVSENTNIRRQLMEWLMNRKRCERKWPWTDLKYYIGICLGGVQKATKTSVRIDGLPATIQYLQNECCLLARDIQWVIERPAAAQLVTIFLTLCETRSSLPFTQESATGTYPKPHESSIHPQHLLYYHPF